MYIFLGIWRTSITCHSMYGQWDAWSRGNRFINQDLLHLVCCFLGERFIVLQEVWDWPVHRDPLIARNIFARKGDLNGMVQDAHAERATEYFSQVGGALGASVATVSDKHDRLVSPLRVEMIEGILEFAGDAPVVLRGEDDEGIAGRDERAPLADGGRGI